MWQDCHVCQDRPIRMLQDFFMTHQCVFSYRDSCAQICACFCKIEKWGPVAWTEITDGEAGWLFFQVLNCWQANVVFLCFNMHDVSNYYFFFFADLKPASDVSKLIHVSWPVTSELWRNENVEMVILVSSPNQSTPRPTGIRDCESSLREGDQPMQTCDLENLHVRSSLLSSSTYRWCFFFFFLNVFMSWQEQLHLVERKNLPSSKLACKEAAISVSLEDKSYSVMSFFLI